MTHDFQAGRPDFQGSEAAFAGDAVSHQFPAPRQDQRAVGRVVRSEPQGQELVYAARVSLDRREMEIEGRLVDLAPGMAVTVEIKTGSRRIIEYVLSPLLRYKQESLRER